MSDRTTWPVILQKLAEFQYRVRRPNPRALSGYELFLLDLAEWRLCFSDRTPVFCPAPDLLASDPITLIEAVRDIARRQGWRERECLILADGNVAELKREVRGLSSPALIILDAADQAYVTGARSLTAALQDVIFAQMSLTSLSPYCVGTPVEGSRFYGRQSEVDKIVHQTKANFAVLGVRRMGKTSLMREARRRMIDQGEHPERVLWLDASTLSGPDSFVREIVRTLHPRELARLDETMGYLFHFPNFLRRMRQMYEGQITIFLDEADLFLTWVREGTRKNAYFSEDLRKALHDATNAGHCRLIVSGFEALQPEISDASSPFYLGFDELHIGPLSLAETEDLVLKPMRSLRLKIANEQELTARIYNDTRGHPLYVQFYCDQILNQLAQSGGRALSPGTIQQIYQSTEFKALVVNSFRDNVATRDKLLIYSLLCHYPEQKETFTQEEMYGALARKGCPLHQDEIDRACDRLILAAVLARDGLRYHFANPILPRVIRANYNLEFLLTAARKELRI